MNKNGFITRSFRILTAMALGLTGIGVASAAVVSNGADKFYKSGKVHPKGLVSQTHDAPDAYQQRQIHEFLSVQ